METLTQTFYEWEHDNINEVCTIEVTVEEFLKRANERLECQTLEEITTEIKELVWNELLDEWYEKNAEKDVEYWEAD